LATCRTAWAKAPPPDLQRTLALGTYPLILLLAQGRFWAVLAAQVLLGLIMTCFFGSGNVLLFDSQAG
jgi:hypothetical protein